MKIENVIALVINNIDLSYKDLSLCNVRSKLYTHSPVRKRYQVFCESLDFYGEYNDPEVACDKFIALKNKIDKGYKNGKSRRVENEGQDM